MHNLIMMLSIVLIVAFAGSLIADIALRRKIDRDNKKDKEREEKDNNLNN